MSMPLPASPTWAELSDVDNCHMNHDTELLASHAGQPSIAEQNRTHGAPSPAVDKGPRPGEASGTTTWPSVSASGGMG